MGRRAKSKGRRAYLRRVPRAYDGLSPYSLRSRGAKAIDLAGELPNTITGWKNGLAISRVVVQEHKEAAIQAKADEVAGYQHWQSWKYQGKFQGCIEWNRIVIQHGRLEELELWFNGNKFIFIQLDKACGQQARSRVYEGRKAAYEALYANQIFYVEWAPIPQ